MIQRKENCGGLIEPIYYLGYPKLRVSKSLLVIFLFCFIQLFGSEHAKLV